MRIGHEKEFHVVNASLSTLFRCFSYKLTPPPSNAMFNTLPRWKTVVFGVVPNLIGYVSGPLRGCWIYALNVAGRVLVDFYIVYLLFEYPFLSHVLSYELIVS